MRTDLTADYPIDIQHSNLGASLGGEMGSDYTKALRLIAANPGLTNQGVSTAIHRPQGSMGVPCRAARETLGLSDTRGAGVVRVADPGRYTSVCGALGVTPAVGSAFVKVNVGPASARDVAAPPEVDPLAAIRVAIVNLRKQMTDADIERIVLTADDAEITRSVRTKSVIHI